MVTQLNLFSKGDLIKERGIKKVLDNSKEEWKESVLRAITILANTGSEFTSDDVRAAIIDDPHHGAAWGAMFSKAVKAKLIKQTGVYVKSKIPSSHSRPIPIWIKY